MKKFEFSLGAVQRYKEQTLDLAKMEYASAMGAVEDQKRVIAQLKESFHEKNEKVKEKSTTVGTSTLELNSVSQYLLYLQEKIDSEVIKQAKLESEAENVKQKMINAKVESASIDILRDKKQTEYNAAVKKSEDAFIEEFISSKMYRYS
jgi:flagellar FliJ protein